MAVEVVEGVQVADFQEHLVILEDCRRLLLAEFMELVICQSLVVREALARQLRSLAQEIVLLILGLAGILPMAQGLSIWLEEQGQLIEGLLTTMETNTHEFP